MASRAAEAADGEYDKACVHYYSQHHVEIEEVLGDAADECVRRQAKDPLLFIAAAILQRRSRDKASGPGAESDWKKCLDAIPQSFRAQNGAPAPSPPATPVSMRNLSLSVGPDAGRCSENAGRPATHDA